ANKIEPRKRMLSSMTPTILVKDGELRAVVGSPGGPTITTTVVQIIRAVVDYGLSIDEVRTGIWQIESEQLVLQDQVVTAARSAFGSDAVETVSTYLANTIRVGDRSIPYSTVAGLRRVPGIDRELTDDEVVLNRWAADDLGAVVGDDVTFTYYEPESTHGVLREAAPITLRLSAIVDLSDGGAPSLAADPRLTPRLPGVTDARSIGDWDLPAYRTSSPTL
ncbi:MAG: gamma-glutamyltransferase, partial [Verrucomicrobiota bacterium]